jgi:hypothetical protein
MRMTARLVAKIWKNRELNFGSNCLKEILSARRMLFDHLLPKTKKEPL